MSNNPMNNALVTVPQKALVASVGRQVKITDKLLARIGGQAFRVPQDGSIYDAVERIRAGGTILLAAGEYLFDRVLHISKALTIVGEDKDTTSFISELTEHYINACHDGEFSIRGVTLRSTDPVKGGMLTVSCGKINIEQCAFVGSCSDDVDRDGFDEKDRRVSCALYIAGSTSGTLSSNIFNSNVNGMVLAFDTTVMIHSNEVTNNFVSGIVCLDRYSGIISDNSLNENRSGIEIHSVGTPILKNNLCEYNAHHGIVFVSNSVGRAENNICSKNKWGTGIAIKESSSVIISGNHCEENFCDGITFFDSATGTAENNICNRNKSVEALETRKRVKRH